VKFSLFIRQISAALGEKAQIHSTGYSPVIGVLLVGLGAMATLFSYIKYSNTKKQLDQRLYYQSSVLIKIVTVIIFLASILMLVYLWKKKLTLCYSQEY